MPSTFMDGPAAGLGLDMRRAPLYLRLVQDASGKWDALDQLDDEPRDGETIHVYEAATPPSAVFACGRGRGAGGGRYEYAVYRHVDVDVEALGLRDTDTWRAWANARGEASQRGFDPLAGEPK